MLAHAAILRVVDECLRKANEIADNHIVFNERAESKALFMANLPRFAAMPHTYGYSGWAAVLSVDLRGSSRRAVRIGPRDTFITMQTYLPTMAYVVGRTGGTVVGLRGDGLFAAFGLTEGPKRPPRSHRADAARDAVNCGAAMLETIDEYIDPGLERYDIEGDLRIGVGIAVGSVVVTRIGWEDAQEVTTYSPGQNFGFMKHHEPGCGSR